MSASPLAPLLGLGTVAAGLWSARWTINADVRRRWCREVSLPPTCFFIVDDGASPGEPLRIAYHSVEPAQLTCRRLGAELGDTIRLADFAPQQQSTTFDHWTGFDWNITEVVSEGFEQLTPGLYVVELASSSSTFRQLAIIRPTPQQVQDFDVAVVLSTATWHAYNDFGGFSNYRDVVTPRGLREIRAVSRAGNRRLRVSDRHRIPAVPLPTGRPNTAVNDDLVDIHLDPRNPFSRQGRAAWSIVRALEADGLRVGVHSDLDLVDRVELDAYPAHVYGPHSEYWSTEMMGRMRSFAERGGHAIFVSGNNLYRRIVVADGRIEVVDDRHDARTTEALIGSAYSYEGYDTFAPYRCVMPEHPLFTGSSLELGEVFAGKGDQGASGFETDKLGPASGAVDLLALGANVEGPAAMTTQTVGKGSITSLGSVASGGWIDRDPVLLTVVGNAIRGLGGHAFDGHAFDGQGFDGQGVNRAEEATP